MCPTDVKLVCFDLGGVIIRICRSWTEGCAAAGLELRGDLDGEPTLPDACHALVVQHQTGRLDGPAYARRFSAALDGLYAPDEILAIHDAWLLDEYDGIAAVIDDLHAAGIVTAALSNTNHEHWRRLAEFPAVRRLRHRFASHEIGHHKPDASAYRHVETALGMTGPEVLFFDDLPENVEAAQALGWQAHLVDPQGDTAAQIRDVLAPVLGA